VPHRLSAGAAPTRIRGLRKSFGDQVVLAGVDLDLHQGENLALFGVSGSGKSVLLKCMLGLIEPDAGSICLGGHEMVGLRRADRLAVNRKVGVLFQNGALFDSLPVWQNVVFKLLSVGGVPQTQARERAADALASVGIGSDTIDLLPADLSGGMQKRVALTRALFGDPEIVLLDSPTAGLDPVLTAIIDSFIASSLRRLNAMALTITHDLRSAMRIAQRAAFLAGGKIVWCGTIATMGSAPEPEVQAFIRAARVYPLGR
jgi:phospholipid/cholesterol/gamma-HCH transport system ATP-binding protein